MRTVKYFCDLCQKQNEKHDLYCVQTPSGMPVWFASGNSQADYWKDEGRHICRECVQEIKK